MEFDNGGSVSISTTAVTVTFGRKEHAYTILNKSSEVVYIQFDAADVTTNTTDLGEGKFWLAQDEGLSVPKTIRFLSAKTAATSALLFVVREERGAE